MRRAVLRKPQFPCLSIFFLASVFGVSTAHAQTVDMGRRSRPRITQNIDEGKLVRLESNTRPEAKPENDRGAVADDFLMEHILLQLHRAPEQEQALQQFIEELHDPNSPNFHKWLTAQEF